MELPTSNRASQLTAEGLAMLRAGDKLRARALLEEAVQLDSQNEQAWLWQSGVVDTDDERRVCLEHVVRINPLNVAARRGLASLPARQIPLPALAIPPEGLPERRDPSQPEFPDLSDVATAYTPFLVTHPVPSAAAPPAPLAVASSPAPQPTFAEPVQPAAPSSPPPTASPRHSPGAGTLFASGLIALLVACIGCVYAGRLMIFGQGVTALASPPSGWAKMEHDGAVLWLPAEFQEVSSAQFKEAMQQLGPALAPLGSRIAGMMQQGASNASLMAFDISQVGRSQFVTNVNVTRSMLFFVSDLDRYIDQEFQRSPVPITILSREKQHHGQFEAIRIVDDVKVAGINSRQLIYVIKTGSTAWTIVYSSSPNEFSWRLPIFERSFETFEGGSSAS